MTARIACGVTALKALAKRLVDGALRRFGLVRTAVAAVQTVEAIYLSTLGRSADINEQTEMAARLSRGELSVPAIIGTLAESAAGRSWRLNQALPALESAGYLSPKAHAEQLVEIAFLAVLGRRPELQALDAYANALQTGYLSVDAFIAELTEAREADLVNAGYLSPKAHAQRVVEIAFLAVLGRRPDSEALSTYEIALQTGSLSEAALVAELASSQEAELRSLELLKIAFKDHGYFSKEEHYGEVVDYIFRSIVGRPLSDDVRHVFVSELISGVRTLDSVVDQVMNSDEVRLRIRQVGLPDVLEGIYRTLRGAPETDPALRGLIRSAASRQTFETIRTMSLTAEASHYMMGSIIELHREQFLEAANA